MSILSIENLNLRVGKFELCDVSLRVDDNHYFVLMGATGSGKTLLLKSICGLVSIGSGSIKLNNADITEMEPRFRRIGYVPQESSLFPHLDVKQNIIFPLKIKGMPYGEAFAKVSDVIDKLEIGTLLDRSVYNLSGGERQKVALARALAGSPDLLVLDEPVSAVDEPTRVGICMLLKSIQREFKITTIHVCHSREEARLVSDVIGIISDGRIIACGKMSDIENRTDNSEIKLLLNGNMRLEKKSSI